MLGTVPALESGSAVAWAGGTAAVTSFEARVSWIASTLSGSPATVSCLATGAWKAVAARYDFDAQATWALTSMHWDTTSNGPAPDGVSSLSPRSCTLAGAFFTRPVERGTRICRHGTVMRWQARRGGFSAPARRVRVRVPLLGECDDWGAKLLAVHVVAHESMHLAGVLDEAVADCLGMQVDALVAMRLGALPGFARSLAREYWALYYPSQERPYRSPACRDGGMLDLFPDRRGWPSPTSYPAGVARRIAAFVAAAR